MVDARSPLPALFLSHGAPLLALDRDGRYARDLRRFLATLPPPAGLAVVSAHWEEGPVLGVTASAAPELIYDFGGFPEELYRIRYPCPGDPALADAIAALLTAAGLPARTDPARGLDHGAWVPLSLALPEARVPVVQISLPRGASPALLLRMGAALGPLRDRGVLVVGTGGAVHNLGRVDLSSEDAPVMDWAAEFDAWLAGRLAARAFADVLRYRSLAPHAHLAAPTPEHFDPLLMVLGAARESERVEWVHEGFQYGSLSMRSFAVV